MTDIRTLAALTALALSTAAGAQAQTFTDKNGTLRFLGCYSQDNGLYCDTTYTLSKGDSLKIGISPSDLTYYTAEGTTGTAYMVSLAGSGYAYYSMDATVVMGIPAKGTYYIQLPDATKTLPAIVLDGHRINNVFISKTGAPSMPPVASVPAQRPAVPAPMPNAGVTGFNIQLTDCKVKAGTYTCIATLTPR